MTMTGEVNLVMQDDVVRLESFELKDDIETVLDLIMKSKYTRVSRATALKTLFRYNTMFWHVHIKEGSILIGVIYLTKVPAGWMLDAYRDDALVKTIDSAMDYSYRAGKLVVDFAMKFANKLITAHVFDNRAATMLCKKLGFKEDFITLKREK